MPNWKKVIVSGSNAILNNITASGDISASGDIHAVNFIGSIATASLANKVKIQPTTVGLPFNVVLSNGGELFKDLDSTHFNYNPSTNLLSVNNIKTTEYISVGTNITASGNISASGTIITSKIHINTSASITANTSADSLVVGSGVGSDGITIHSQNNSNGSIFFADDLSPGNPAGNRAGVLHYNHPNDEFQLRTAGNQIAATIDNNNANFEGNISASGYVSADHLVLDINSSLSGSEDLYEITLPDGVFYKEGVIERNFDLTNVTEDDGDFGFVGKRFFKINNSVQKVDLNYTILFRGFNNLTGPSNYTKVEDTASITSGNTLLKHESSDANINNQVLGPLTISTPTEDYINDFLSAFSSAGITNLIGLSDEGDATFVNVGGNEGEVNNITSGSNISVFINYKASRFS